MNNRDRGTDLCALLDLRLDDILDGDAPGGETAVTRSDAQTHVSVCPRCQGEHGPLLAFLRQAASGSDVPLPTGARPPVAAEVPRRMSARPGLTRIAAILLVAAAAGLWWRAQQPSIESETPRESQPSVVLRPLQRLTPIRIERRERVVEWRPVGTRRSEYRTVTAPRSDVAALALSEETHR